MRILHVNPFFHPFMGGTEKYLYDLCVRLAEKNNVSVITSRIENTEKYEEIKGIKVHRLNSFIFKKLFPPLPPPYSIPLFFPYHFLKICRKEKPDIIHLHNRFFLNFNSVIFLKKILKKPLFLSLHNARPVGINPKTDFFGQLYDNFIGNIIMRSADKIIANSRWTLKATAPQDYPKNQTTVIYNGVDTKVYKKVRSDLKDRLGCEHLSLTVCRLLPQKGVEDLIRALPKIKELEKDFKAVIVGCGPEKAKLQKLSEDLGVSKNVHFAGFVPDDKLPYYYSGADFSILPSLYEPFGIVLVESMACGTPCIATWVGGIPEVIGDAGLMVPPRRPDIIVQAVDYMMNKKICNDFAKKARKRAEKIFEWDLIAKQVEGSYKNYLEREK